ncbi:hypothetical protein NPIL_556981 [Nephila pilipes]|uniref:Uncharacterized protein n=1 Tax=Nephila pilipes TaxID=299642 RepID=A0A8X6TZ47_NEPPI|nr:hypothetical protein NPIL_556981 [Nephila pilipes]
MPPPPRKKDSSSEASSVAHTANHWAGPLTTCCGHKTEQKKKKKKPPLRLQPLSQPPLPAAPSDHEQHFVRHHRLMIHHTTLHTGLYNERDGWRGKKSFRCFGNGSKTSTLFSPSRDRPLPW